jgi:hypothetical protein
MSLGRLGRWDEGKTELARAETNLRQSLERMTGDYWWEVAQCQVLLEEAHRLFGVSGPR